MGINTEGLRLYEVSNEAEVLAHKANEQFDAMRHIANLMALSDQDFVSRLFS